MYSRRRFLTTSVLGGLAVGVGLGSLGWAKGGLLGAMVPEAQADETFAVTHTNEEWHRLLDPDQYKVLREADTERPYSSPLNDEHRNGTFSCAGCQQGLFASATKFDSHTGWPSFWAPLDKAVAVRDDRSFGVLRQEVHCSRCGGHLGHVFDDGPRPTGLRYCMNGLALGFAPNAS